MEKLTTKESLVLKVLGFATVLYGLVAAAVLSVLDLFKPEIGVKGKLLAGAIALGGTSLGIIGMRERLLRRLASSKLLLPRTHRAYLGTYNLEIEHGTPPVRRNGTVKVSCSPLGLKLTGGKLYDSATDRVCIESWSSDFAELVEEDGRFVLVYLYGTTRSESRRSKLGWVVAVSQGDDVGSYMFRGTFEDIAVLHDYETRSNGAVRLFKAEV
jgi:hypothetical protein